jgi:peptidoglycan L-alanyl-D-glutamate endopeptidase CwlK
MASRRIEDLNEILASAYQKAKAEYDKKFPTAPQPFITCTYRSNEEQTALFNQPTDGKDNNGNGIIDDRAEKVTQAQAGQSPHNYHPSYAFDIAFINPLTQKLDWSPKNFENFALVIKSLQPLVEWGGDWKFKDAPHFELKDWKRFKQQANEVV